jgi:AraC-like DNA-binding protein
MAEFRHHRFSSKLPSQIEEWYRSNFAADHARSVTGSGPWSYDLMVLGSPRKGFSRTTLEGEHVVRATLPADWALLHVCSGSPVTIRVGRRVLDCDRANAVLLVGDHTYTARPGNTVITSVAADLGRLSREVESRSPAPARNWLPRCMMLPLDRFRNIGLLDELDRAFEQPTRHESEDWLERWNATAVATLAAVIVDVRGFEGASLAAVETAERLEDWIVHHLSQPISLALLGKQSDTSARWLQKSFLQRWGQTPLEFVANKRLAAVRARLARMPRGATVTSIAIECGFTHLGRFSALYRRAYGELPSETVQRLARERSEVAVHGV